MNGPCEVVGCEKPMAVGIGIGSRWVCLEHYEEYLKNAAAIVSRLQEALSPRGGNK